MPLTAAQCATPPEQVSEDDVFNVSAAYLLKHDNFTVAHTLPHIPGLTPSGRFLPCAATYPLFFVPEVQPEKESADVLRRFRS